MIQAKMIVIDLNLSLDFGHSKFEKTKGMADVYRTNYLLSVDGLHFKTRVQKMYETTQGQLLYANIFMSRSITVYDVRSVDLSREPSGHRNMFACYELQALPCWYTWQGFQKHSGKSNMDYGLRSYRKVDKRNGLRSDQTIFLRGPQSSKDYSEELRRVSYYDTETNKCLVFVTNCLLLDAMIIAQLYKCRWQVELFFKWIKQYLRIKAFYGISENAVKTQMWIAISVYVLVAIVKKQLKLERNLGEILQILSITLFEKSPILQALMVSYEQNQYYDPYKQLSSFNF